MIITSLHPGNSEINYGTTYKIGYNDHKYFIAIGDEHEIINNMVIYACHGYFVKNKYDCPEYQYFRFVENDVHYSINILSEYKYMEYVYSINGL